MNGLSRLIAFAERALSTRTFDLIIAPAVADLHFELRTRPEKATASQRAVVKAVAGAFAEEIARASGSMVQLALLPAAYYIFLMVMCFDVFSIALSKSFVIAATVILLLSIAPVMACFWPERQRPRSAN